MGKVVRVLRQVKEQLTDWRGWGPASVISALVLATMFFLPVTDSVRAAILLSVILFNMLRFR